MRQFLLRLEQNKVAGATSLPRFADGYVDGCILIKSMHMGFYPQNSDFRRVAPEGAPLGAGQQ